MAFITRVWSTKLDTTWESLSKHICSLLTVPFMILFNTSFTSTWNAFPATCNVFPWNTTLNPFKSTCKRKLQFQTKFRPFIVCEKLSDWNSERSGEVLRILDWRSILEWCDCVMHMCFGLVALVVCYFSSHRSLRETVIRLYHAIMWINRYPQLGQKEIAYYSSSRHHEMTYMHKVYKNQVFSQALRLEFVEKFV